MKLIKELPNCPQPQKEAAATQERKKNGNLLKLKVKLEDQGKDLICKLINAEIQADFDKTIEE